MFENYQIEYFKSNFIKSYLINLLNKLQKIEEKFMDKEKLERYRLIIEEYQQERKKDLINFILIVILLILLIALLIYI